MGKPKLPLKYFARLIDFGGLREQRESIHAWCKLRAMGQGAQLADDETVVYQDYASSLELKFPYHNADPEFVGGKLSWPNVPPLHLFKPALPSVYDIKKDVCYEVECQVSKSMAKLYEQLSTGTQSEQELVCKQALRDLDKWSGIVADDPLYSKYPCIGAALQEIRAYLKSHNPLSNEMVMVDAPALKMEPVVGFLYQCLEAGAKPDRIKTTTQRHLGNLYSVLKDDLKLIAPETTLENFCTVFSGQIVSVPVRWLGTNAQLRHLLMAIEPKLTQSVSNRVRGKWKIAAACFVKSKGEIFKSSQIESTGNGERGVRMASEIEAAAKKLK
ncbi:MAG: hypothetical protein EOO58_00050 [Hymenobacter sp.]|nr:MAG: hypothetical protein EOO58_00050 [Hymenobacter sp.]